MVDHVTAEKEVTEMKCWHCNGSGGALVCCGNVDQSDGACCGCPNADECETCFGEGVITTIAQYLQTLPAEWHANSSLETWFPLTAGELKLQKAVIDSQARRIAELEASFYLGGLSIEQWREHAKEGWRQAAELRAVPPREGLFDAIAHGDERHRAWLKQAIGDYFAGRPVLRPDAIAVETGACETCRATNADDCYYSENPPVNCRYPPAVETSPPLPVPSDDLRDYGYAPGNYIGGCLTCHKQMWNVDKRCRICKECAESRREKAMTGWRASLSEEPHR